MFACSVHASYRRPNVGPKRTGAMSNEPRRRRHDADGHEVLPHKGAPKNTSSRRSNRGMLELSVDVVLRKLGKGSRAVAGRLVERRRKALWSSSSFPMACTSTDDAVKRRTAHLRSRSSLHRDDQQPLPARSPRPRRRHRRKYAAKFRPGSGIFFRALQDGGAWRRCLVAGDAIAPAFPRLALGARAWREHSCWLEDTAGWVTCSTFCSAKYSRNISRATTLAFHAPPRDRSPPARRWPPTHAGHRAVGAKP